MVTAPDQPTGADYRQGPHSRFVIGADLGQSVDQTAIIAIERKVEATEEVKTRPGRHYGATDVYRELQVSYRLRGAELLPLGTTYQAVAAHLAARVESTKPFGPVNLVFDETGNRAGGDLIRAAIEAPRPIACTLSPSERDNQISNRRWSVSKANMVTGLLSALENGYLTIAGDLRDFDNFAKHLVDLRRKISAMGHLSFNAREGGHDDYVSAAGLGWWWCSRPLARVRQTKLAGF